MENESMASRNMRCLLILMVLYGSLLGGTVMQDAWIAILTAGFMFLPMLLMYARICSLFPGKNLFDIMRVLFNRAVRSLILLPLFAYAVFITALTLRTCAEFTVVSALQETPCLALMIVLMIPVLYLAQQGGRVLGRWAILICAIIFMTIAATVLLSLNVIEVRHLLPVMSHNFVEIGSEAFTLGIVTIGETAVVMLLFANMKKEDSSYKTYLPGIGLGLLLLAAVYIRNLLILGPDMELAAKFPSYMAVRIIHVSNFIERIESSISFSFIFLGITKMALCLSAAAMGAAELFAASAYRRFLIPVGLLTLMVSSLLFKNIYEIFGFLTLYWFLALPFQLAIPLLIWIAAEIKANEK